MKLSPIKKIFFTIALTITAFLSIYAYRLSAEHQIKGRIMENSSSAIPEAGKQPEPVPQPVPAPEPEKPETSSESEKTQPFGSNTVTILAVGIDAGQKLTDVIMLAKLNLEAGVVSVLHIPRDSFVGDNITTGKINAVYSTKKGGIQSLKQTVEDITALKVDYYATITLEGLRNIVDNLGGVEIDIPIRINYLPGKVLQPGVQKINGEKAEWIVRYRAGYASGDLGRINTQKLLIEALINKIKSEGRMTAFSAITKNYNYITTDLPITKMLSLANDAISIEAENIKFYTAPGSGMMHNGFAVYALDKHGLSEILNAGFRNEDEAVPASYLKIKRPYPD